jgi:hypothetical protein
MFMTTNMSSSPIKNYLGRKVAKYEKNLPAANNVGSMLMSGLNLLVSSAGEDLSLEES